MILVVDEVFGDYAFSDKVSRTWKYVFAPCHPERNEVESMDLWDAGGGDFINLPKDGPKCPIFWLNGLSKAVGSPQLKLGWMAFYAPRENFEEIRAALEFVEDAYLSVSAPAQALGASLLKLSAAYESKVLDRLQQNWQTLREAFPSKYCPEVLGGWYAVVHLGDDDFSKKLFNALSNNAKMPAHLARAFKFDQIASSAAHSCYVRRSRFSNYSP